MTAYFDTFRSVVLTPDNITLLADGVSDTLTINAAANKGLSLSASANGSDTLDLNVDYSFSVPIGTSILRLQDVNANQKDITLSAGANITITRNSASELVLSSTVGGNSKAIGGATVANPVVITTTAAHGFTEGIPVTLSDIAGMTQLNGNEYFMDILTSDTFALYTDANLSVTLDGTGFSAYTSGGVATAEYQTTNLSQMGDVLLTSPSVGKVLYHNGAKWIDQIIDTSVITENTNLFYTDTRADNRIDNFFNSVNIALGSNAGSINQGASAVAIGSSAGKTDQGGASVAIGQGAGFSGQNDYAVALGVSAGNFNQGARSVAIGEFAGLTNQGAVSIAIGDRAGYNTQAANSIVLNATGNVLDNATASSLVVKPIRNATNSNYLQYNSTTGEITYTSDLTFDGDITGSIFADDSTLLVDGVNGKIVGDIETSKLRTSEAIIRLGLMAGDNGQNTGAIAIGTFAAAGAMQGDSAIAIGMYAGDSGQSFKSVAIGYKAGMTNQGESTVAIGKNAGYASQGVNSIAIGTQAGYIGQTANSIVINATGGTVNNTQSDSFVVKPIRNAVNANYLQYNSTSGEITYTNDLALDGVLTGSVFGDDSSLLVDGINNRLVMANNTTDDLAEGSNNKYFTNGRAIAMTIVFG